LRSFWNIDAGIPCGRYPDARQELVIVWMKREGLLRHLRRNGCVLRREGKEHTLWENPRTGDGSRFALNSVT
jgi:hypothetical protein